jgi:hypothetical protein
MTGKFHDPSTKQAMVKRKRNNEGCGFIFAEGKVRGLSNEVFDCYLMGHYYATIASMAVERICYDFIDLLPIY